MTTILTKELEKSEFSLLCFDDSNQCAFGDDPVRFAHILRGSTELFSKDVTITDSDAACRLDDRKNNLTLTINRPTGLINLDYTSVFYIQCEFKDFQKNPSFFDAFRLNLVKYLKNEKFTKIYITRDDVSSSLLSKIYFKINKVENLLRSYVTKHLSITEGIGSWFNQTVDSEVLSKVFKRKNNENIFSDENHNVVDTKIYLIDFEDLGNIIYANSFGNFKAADLVSKIESASNLEDLRSNIAKNIDKYFGAFKEVGFQEKWVFLKSIRHKVAHNGLTSLDEIATANDYLNTLIEFIESIDKEVIETASLAESYSDIEKSGYTHSSDYRYLSITKDELLMELKKYQHWCNDIGRDFLGLKNFLHNRLGGMGYHIGKAWDMLEELEKDGYIKIVTWSDPKNIYPDQKAIEVTKRFI